MTIKIQHCIRTLRLKVKAEGYAWLKSAAIEVNQVWNYANATSYKAARPFAGPAKWLTAFDLDKLSAGASEPIRSKYSVYRDDPGCRDGNTECDSPYPHERGAADHDHDGKHHADHD
jgi:hypothetical protein